MNLTTEGFTTFAGPAVEEGGVFSPFDGMKVATGGEFASFEGPATEENIGFFPFSEPKDQGEEKVFEPLGISVDH